MLFAATPDEDTRTIPEKLEVLSLVTAAMAAIRSSSICVRRSSKAPAATAVVIRPTCRASSTFAVKLLYMRPTVSGGDGGDDGGLGGGGNGGQPGDGFSGVGGGCSGGLGGVGDGGVTGVGGGWSGGSDGGGGVNGGGSGGGGE